MLRVSTEGWHCFLMLDPHQAGLKQSSDKVGERGRGPFSHLKDQPTLCFLQLPGVCLKLPHYRMQECTCTLAATALSLK